MECNAATIYRIKQMLDERKKNFDLDGVEITDEDAIVAIELVNHNNYMLDKSINLVLNSIYDVISEGYED